MHPQIHVHTDKKEHYKWAISLKVLVENVVKSAIRLMIVDQVGIVHKANPPVQSLQSLIRSQVIQEQQQLDIKEEAIDLGLLVLEENV
jgi:hypothetical protein